ncbi:MAG: Pyrroline-5-carboxylate reductase [Candidatus Hecatellales archaeon B24]|nr:MAG: Pyrroline-5-carboxylate reductase [Candidatus Hecatellales archaeon B24]
MVAKRIGVIGAGKIGEALISGLLKSGMATSENLRASDVAEQRCGYIAETYGIPCTTDNRRVVEGSDVIIVSVQPRDIGKVLEEISGLLTAEQLLVSTAAGVSVSYILKSLKRSDIQVVRIMPNIAVLVREGIIAVAPAGNVTEENLKVVKEIFGSVGRVVVVEERHMDAVTGLSGSGPAYIYLIVEALVEAGVKVGLPRELSFLLATQTVLGSARMVLETREHPAKLRELVTTPGGVTIDGIIELEEGKIRTTIIKAVVKATQRAKELLMN